MSTGTTAGTGTGTIMGTRTGTGTSAGAGAPEATAAGIGADDVVVKSVAMEPDMFADFVSAAKEAMEKLNKQQAQAEHIKRHFDNKHSPVWHCIVGSNFGSCVSHEEKCFAYIYMRGEAILLFKAGRNDGHT